MRGLPAVAAAALLALLGGIACRPGEGQTAARTVGAELGRREARLARALDQPAPGAPREAVIARWVLGGGLSEISGLALTADGRLFAHGDERGRVFELDYRRGAVIKQFTLGTREVSADFEGITVADGVLFLLAGNGTLYQFAEGANGEHVEYVVHDTRLARACEFEGVAFDPTLNALLLACKNVRTKGPLRNSLVIYRWTLPGGGGSRSSRLTVPLAQVIGSNGWKGFHPSDITIDPVNGNYVLVAAQEKALIEITPAGAVVFARSLPASLVHTEGVAITADSLLILGAEAGAHPATLSLYRWP